jgi:apolipoprotein N-acyltransferase
MLQLASLTGPWGISFILLSFSSAVAIGVSLRRTNPRKALQIVSAMVATIALALVFGAIRLALPPPPGQAVKVGLVASDFGLNKGVAAPGVKTENLLKDYAVQAEALAARGAQVIVLPEHLGEVTDAQAPSADTIFQPLADKTGSTIVVGVGYESPQDPRNQARVYLPHSAPLLYNKHHLLPPWESRFTPGATLTVLPESNTKWGVAICKDMDFTPLSRQYGQAGVGLMLVPGWDFVLDRVSHGHMAIMRGVESGFAMARAGRGGSLLVTDNRGRILGETASNSAPFATLLVDVPAIHDSTIYLLFGDWFAYLDLGILAFTLVRLMASRVA